MVPTTRHLLWLSAFAVLASCDYTSLQIGAWDRPRAAIIRDHVYLEGGNPSIGTWNGATWAIGPSITVSNGILFNLSLHQPFNVSDKQAPALFASMIETEVGNYYVDGAMFADYNEFYAWGGLPLSTADATFRTVNDIFYDLPPGKDPNSAGVANTNFAPDNGAFLPATNGAGASAPSEKLGFYFGGYYSANGTSYSYFKQPTDELPYLVQVDMKDEGAAYFSTPAVDNTSAPWRAEAGLVWVPTSTQGILVAIGGVTNPADMHYGVGTNNASLPFLKEFPIYDIGTSNWTSQAINADSPFPDGPLAQFCTVVASAPDGSHHDIFVYGGWNGSTGGKPQAEVWILTIPSFTWVKANSSDTARQGHVCVQPYADEMIVIGGTGQGGGSLTTEKSVDVFNLSSWEWTGVYDPTVDEPYRPNEAVLSVITATPTASGMVTAVARLFETKYDTSSISTFSFTATSTTTPSSNATNSATPPPSKHHNRAWVVPVAVTGSVVGGLVILGALFFFCCYSRNRKQRQQHNQQETAEAGHRKSMLLPWLWATHNAGAPKDVGSDTITEVEPTVPQELEGGGSKWYDGNESRRNERWPASTQVRSPRADYDGPVEAQGTAVNEMHAQSKSINPDGIDYNILNMALYPPSVVSGGNASHEHSTSISQVDASEEAPASPRTTSAAVPSSPRGFTTIPEGNVPSADTYPFAATLGPLDPAPPVSPMGRQQQRPGHHRHNSSVSSGMSMTMPSPDLDQSALPARPRGARSVSSDEHDVEEDPHSRTF